MSSSSSSSNKKKHIKDKEKKRKQPPPHDNDNNHDAATQYNLVWPCRQGVLGNANELTVVLQIDPSPQEQQQGGMDYSLEGASGVIGRLEVDATGVILDMRGRQYHGRIYPGPTAMILETPGLAVGSKRQHDNATTTTTTTTIHQDLKVIGITDEFVRCQQEQGDIMERLSATYEKGGPEESVLVMPPPTTASASTTVRAKKTPKAKTAVGRKKAKTTKSNY